MRKDNLETIGSSLVAFLLINDSIYTSMINKKDNAVEDVSM